jgi:pilus assembly protein CpaD
MATTKTALLCAALLAVSACAVPDPVPTDYRQKYALPVAAETVVLPLAVGAPGAALSEVDERRVELLVSGYLDRSHGPITVSMLAPADADASRQVARLRSVSDRLVQAGIPASSIRLLLTDYGPVDAVTLTYQRFDVALPACGDWSSNPRYDHSNDVHSDFGCTLQRDVGLMVADPADLVRMRDASAPDAPNASRVVQKYRAGQPPGSIGNPQQIQGASGLSKP